MKAALFYGVGDIRIEEVDIPKITKEEILLKVRACAVCGTDLRIWKFGHFKIPEGTQRVLGHEVAGEIVNIVLDPLSLLNRAGELMFLFP